MGKGTGLTRGAKLHTSPRAQEIANVLEGRYHPMIKAGTLIRLGITSHTVGRLGVQVPAAVIHAMGKMELYAKKHAKP